MVLIIVVLRRIRRGRLVRSKEVRCEVWDWVYFADF